MKFQNSAPQGSTSTTTEFSCQPIELAEKLRKIGFTRVGRMRPWLFIRTKTDDVLLVWDGYATTTSVGTATLLAELLAAPESRVTR